MRCRILLALCVLALCFASRPLRAQVTGGSMGGADFSSGASGGGSGGASYDSGSSSHDGGSSSAGNMSADDAKVGYFIAGGLLLVFLVLAPFATRGPAVGAGGPMVFSSLVLGIDWHSRRELQGKLAALAAQNLGGTAEGRAKMLHEVVLALERAELSWLYIAASVRTGLPPAAAEADFLTACEQARSRFRRELIRSEGGEVATEAAGPLALRPDEGPGAVVVSLILVTRRPFARKAGMSDASVIRAALDDRAAVTSQELVAIEVVWSPAAENDRMSTAELEQHYPELAAIDPKSIAGRFFCSYCGGVFAMELLSCPHCGGAVDRGA